ncbi:MAG: tetratricopeptide repeat protein, partial [Treponema sp.]|nr:tetratricopeptide repeat protein [Treponema sp.]
MKKSIAKRESPGLKKLALAVEMGKRGKYRQAINILGELIAETEAPPEAWLLLGRSLHAVKDYSRALAAFNDFIQQKPESAEGYLFAGRTYLTLGMPFKAVRFLRKALDNSPGETDAAVKTAAEIKALLGTAYLKSKHSLAAVTILQQAVEAAPADKRIYRAYLNSLLVRGIRLTRGEPRFNEAAAHGGPVRGQGGIDDHELGIQMLRFVLKNGAEAGIADTPLLRLELGRATRDAGNLEEALEHFTRALELTGNDDAGAGEGGAANSGDRRIRWARASILMALGKTAEARNEIERIRSRDSGVPELPWNSELVDLFMIRSFLADGLWREASESCRNWLWTRGKLRNTQSREDRQRRSMIHALYAEALRNLGNFEAAHNHLQRAQEDNPEELEFWYADILVSWEKKDFSSLKKALRAAKALGGDPDIIKRFTILCEAKTSKDAKGIITLLQNAIRTLGPEPELMQTLGEAYLKIGLLEEALGWFKKTVTLNANHE